MRKMVHFTLFLSQLPHNTEMLARETQIYRAPQLTFQLFIPPKGTVSRGSTDYNDILYSVDFQT